MRRAALAALVSLAAAAACRRPSAVRAGDSVLIHYALSADGAVVETTFGGAPVEIVAGAGQVPPGADAALLGMEAGQEKRLELSPAQAFGPRDPARVESLPLASFGALAAGLTPGKKVSGFRDGKAQNAVVVSVGGGTAALDFNPPLAGKDVVYRLRVVSVSPR